ncbi:MAG: NgoFVII family restriction endonuclease [Treponema sp.]|jgi:hypothetical protein|nr:NgoFVII family restriction endonuclease [Treponema sp.]
MIYNDLYNEVLLKPCLEGADTLKIISGYATSAMAFHHLEELTNKNSNIHISLLLGMCPSDGISFSNHRGFLNIINSAYSNKFTCGYIFKYPPVHSKLYIWCKKNKLYRSFIGSANYTQNAFSKKQREVLAEINDNNVINYFSMVEKDSIYCENQEADQLIRIYNDKNYYKSHLHEERDDRNTMIVPTQDEVEKRTILLVDRRTGEVQNVAGLNWGHRRNNPNRNRNEAYIQLPPDVYRSDFFPPKPQHFTVITDDSKTFICRRAQKTGTPGTAIETPHNNALLGEYFRNRMGLANGAFVTRRDLDNYGRIDVTFYKFDDENYYMDFQPQNK